MVNVHEMLEAVNAERARIPGTGPLRMTKAVRQDLMGLASFMRERSLDPMLWIRSQFAARGYRVSPRVRQMASEKSIPRYEAFGADAAASASGQDRLRAEVAPAARQGLSPLAELAKRRLRATPELCRAQAASLTLGWHPGSAACGSCPLAAVCRTALPSAILARRDADARRISLRA